MGGSVYRGYGDEHRAPEPGSGTSIAIRRPRRLLFASGVPIFTDAAGLNPGASRGQESGTDILLRLSLDRPVDPALPQWAAHTDNHAPDPTLFDPVAVTYAIRRAFPAKPLRIEVDDKGMTRPVDGPPNAQVCLRSDEQGFLSLLLSRIATGERRGSRPDDELEVQDSAKGLSYCHDFVMPRRQKLPYVSTITFVLIDIEESEEKNDGRSSSIFKMGSEQEDV